MNNTDIVSQKKNKKLQDSAFFSLDPFWFFVSISSLPALFLTITLWLSGIKTIFYEERGTFRHRWFRGYISVFFMLLLYITFVNIILYVFLFLAKSLWQKKDRSQRKKTGKHLLIFLSNQLVFNLFLIWLWKGRTKSTSVAIMLVSFLSIILNSFFIHYFFSKPTMNLLIKKYPYYFSKAFCQEKKSLFKKVQTFDWAMMITLILVNFWILSQLFYLYLFKVAL